MLNIVIPMAGRGSRFQERGYREPKPFIPVLGRPMIEWVVRNVTPRQPHRFHFIVLEEHLLHWNARETLETIAPSSTVTVIREVTQGAACTVLLAQPHIKPGEAMLIVNSDQFVDTSIDAFVDSLERRRLDACIMTMTADHPKWSYAKVDESGLVTQVAEKQVISPHATVGLYLFAKSSDFASGAHEMIALNDRVNGEFYVAPVFNRLIARGLRVGTHDIGLLGSAMHGLGVPEDLEAFVHHPTANRAARELFSS